MPPTRLPRKKDVALALLEQSSVFVHLDPRAERVSVPLWFKKQPQLVLQIGLNMAIPIPDLQVDEEGLSCTLSFNRSPHYCVVPWGSVYALVGEDGRGMVWPDDVPPEVAAQMQQKAAPKAKLAAVGQGTQAGQGGEAQVAKKAAAVPAASKSSGAAAEAGAGERARPTVVARQAAKGRTAAADSKPAEPVAADAAAKAEPPKKKRARRKASDKADAPKALAPVAQAASESDKDSSAPPSGKPKRELPPYLRVIK